MTSADPYAQNRRNRFVGICIQRERHGLKHQFTLRNIVDGLGEHFFSFATSINNLRFVQAWKLFMNSTILL